MNKIKFKNPRAFSLIELSIVLLIIGLVVAGIIGGKKIVSMANLSKARALTSSSPVAGIEGLSLWLEATSKNSFLSSEIVDGSTVSIWKDINPQSTNKKDVTATLSARPTYTENANNGLPAVYFNGTSNILTRVNTFGYELTKSNEVSIFSVVKTVGPAKFSAIFRWGINPNRLSLAAPFTNYLEFCFATNGGITFTPTDFFDKWNIVSAIRKTGGSANIAVNNAIVVSSSLPSSLDITQSATLSIGAFLDVNPDYERGYIGEMIVFDRALSDDERLEITKYLSKKWGIKIS